MKKIFNRAIEEIKDRGALNTATEIYNQPKLWKEVLNILTESKDKIASFMEGAINKEGLRIILTGAGTSAYVGEIAAPYLSKLLGIKVEAIATTDIVSNPKEYLQKNNPTILVSFARSGNSPESVGTFNLSKDLIEDVSQIVITCNKDGELANRVKSSDKDLLLLMPEESNDKSFAMTSSFSCMLLTVLCIFDIKNTDENLINTIIKNATKILDNHCDEINKLVEMDFKRVVYLGSGSLKGLTKESSLKNLELTSGRVDTYNEAVLAFRHGPKSVINDETLIIVFLSNDSYTRKYDLDLIKEIHGDNGEQKVAVISHKEYEELKGHCDYYLSLDKEEIDDAFSAMEFVVFAQLFGMFNSLRLGISPDNPRPDGSVNRVVKGVSIYPFN
ncbi:tagatose-6-phosphate aldose/ketose isomerase [Clostridium putrefaciens]|uniref:Tagatose-6-phosphate aldose/ketose isomerase n=1 Tax=Clostridium putrefaciens TaxID=99675 RepID=A0A381J6Q3_9CLOT|nr:SIS domain-containing protein [Clostridium putrefaciens]SUY46251.1 tagatose-6-phosphate aldose/ketose isomerase [Clostridium putrefaciens]